MATPPKLQANGWYHFPNDRNGKPLVGDPANGVPPGQWVLVCSAPDDAPDVVEVFEISGGRLAFYPTDDIGHGFPIIAGCYFNALDDQCAIAGSGDTYVTLEEFIALSFTGGCKQYQFSNVNFGDADDYTVTKSLICAQQQISPNGTVCPPGTYYDPLSETCRPLCGTNPAKCVLPPPCLCLTGAEQCCQPSCPIKGCVAPLTLDPVKCRCVDPIPSHLPLVLIGFEVAQDRKLAAPTRAGVLPSRRVPPPPAAWEPWFLALNPTRKRGVPSVFKSCSSCGAADVDGTFEDTTA